MCCVIRSLNIEITKNFEKANILPRPTKSNGLWCGFLLPTILLVYTWQYETSHTYRVTAYLGIGLMIYNLLFIFYIAFDCLLIKEPVYAGCMISMIMSSLLMVFFVGESLPYALSLTSSFIFLNYCLLRYALNAFPLTFTVGEATIVVQGIVLLLATSCTKMLIEKGPEDFVNTILYCIAAGGAGIVAALYSLPPDRREASSLTRLLRWAVIAEILLLHSWLGAPFILHCLAFVLRYPHRLQLISFWAALAAAAALVVWARVRRGVRADTANRKVFHILASLVFASGMLVDMDLMRLAAGLGLVLLVIIEALRKTGIPPVSDALESAFKIYKDEKDNGAFALTPIYLYCGLACPLLLVPEAAVGGVARGAAGSVAGGVASGAAGSVARLAGVLACGVGDAAASWLGAKYGRLKWPRSQRTVEGTLFNFLAQVATVAALFSLGLLQDRSAWAVAAAAAAAAAAVEARTEQVDNLVLPLISILACQAAHAIQSLYYSFS